VTDVNDVSDATHELDRPPAPDATGVGVAVRLEELRRIYGSVHALDGLSLDLAPGELVALLGPSGCGKTTALRLLAGLEDCDGGKVYVDGKDLTGVPANKRDMGMVFQAYSLFPHMTTQQNVEFGLRLRGVDGKERSRRASEMLELVGLGPQAHRYPHQMSGGQQQRVALARALAIRPQVLLLDEPLSALDAKVRVQLRDEIRRIQLEVGTTTLFVTHDQEEALAMADRVGVMRAGNLEQIGTPAEVYSRPATPFVADFVGLSNRIEGTVSHGSIELLGQRVPVVAGSPASGRATALVRPEAIEVARDEHGAARVVSAHFLGATSRVSVAMPDGTMLAAQIASSDVAMLAPGTAVRVTLLPVPVAVETDVTSAQS
jgi:putative spermidine/putrescine transport system ATP-binding protein